MPINIDMAFILRWNKFNHMFENDILLNYSSQKFGCPEGWFFWVWVSKWHPDALLAKTGIFPVLFGTGLLASAHNNNNNNDNNNNNNNLYFTRVTQSNTGFDFRCGPQKCATGW